MKITSKKFTLTIATAALLTTSACSGSNWFGEKEKAPLPGERISVLELQRSLEPDDPALSAQGFIAPEAWNNEFWPQAGGYPNHTMQHLALNPDQLQVVWKADIGEGANRDFPLTAAPIVVDGRIFTMDRKQNLTAFNAADGTKLWSVNVRKASEEDLTIGGGVAYSAGKLYVTNGYNQLLCLNPADGSQIWQYTLPAPARAAPTVLDNRVFAVTLDNKIVAIGAEKGEYLWDYSGISAVAGLIGQASPAATRSMVIPAFSSGELYALQVENGMVAWSENLSGQRIISGLASITDIRGLPVIDKGLVIAVSFGGRLVAIDERTGNRVWQREIGSAQTPWVVGNHIFVITNNGELVAIGRDNGAIRWVAPLARFEDQEDKKNPVQWGGPVMAGGRLILVANNGWVAEVSTDGQIIRDWDVGAKVSLPLVVAAQTLYILTDDGTLLAYR